jgi:RND family efflux transporter MFP subunit
MSTLYRYISQIKNYALAHKAISAVVLVVVLGGAWYTWGRGATASAATHYVMGSVVRGTVVESVSASGQISAQNQVDLKPKASGAITYVGVQVGQEVRQGQVLVRLDSGDAGYQLQSAELSYQKLITVDPQSLIDAQQAVAAAVSDQTAAYLSARAALTKAVTDMTTTLQGINSILGGYLATQNGLSSAESDSRKQAQDSWYAAQSGLDALTKAYRALPADASQTQVDAMLAQAYSAALSVADAAKSAQDAVVFFRGQAQGNPTAADAAFTSITTLVQSANGIPSSISSTQSSIANDAHTLEKAQAALETLQAGPAELDRRAQALDVEQKQQALADYSVAAPFAGIVAAVPAKVGADGAPGTTAVTLITQSKIAQISLNEVDAAKVAVGQKATLTFDAIDNLTLTGTVAEVDQVGTVTQGVVSYGVQIALDAQDSRIKPGMTVNAKIEVATATDVLTVPASAVKSQGGASYVLEFNPPLASSTVSTAGTAGVVSSVAPVQVPVETGIADDTSVEITSGLSEGEQVVVRTINASSATTATASRTAAGGTAARGGVGGGAVLRGL